MSAIRAAQAASGDTADHHRIDASLCLDGGYAVQAGAFRHGTTRWREEDLHPGLKIILLDGQARSRVEDRPAWQMRGPSLCLAWNPGGARGADAFEAGVAQRYAMVRLPASALWQELGVDPDCLARLDPAAGSGAAVWHGAASREARRIADQLRVCRYEGPARALPGGQGPGAGRRGAGAGGRLRSGRARLGGAGNRTPCTRPGAGCWPICGKRRRRPRWRANWA